MTDEDISKELYAELDAADEKVIEARIILSLAERKAAQVRERIRAFEAAQEAKQSRPSQSRL